MSTITMTPLQELGHKIKAIDEKVRGILAEAGEAPTEAHLNDIKSLNREREQFELKAEVERAKEYLEKGMREPVQTALFPGKFAEAKTVGEAFTGDARVQQFMKDWGVQQTGKFGSSPAANVDVKTLITGGSSTSAGALINDQYTGIIDAGLSYRRITLLDLIPTAQATSNAIQYVKEKSHTNSADFVAEATATGDGTGGKPESAMVFEEVTDAIKTVAHWIPATRNALMDSDQIRGMIDKWLRYGLRAKLETAIMSGAGGNSITGFTQASVNTQAADTDIFTTLLKAKTKVEVSGGGAMANAFVIHPNDWQKVLLLEDNEARYYYGGPGTMGNPILWGIPVVISQAVAEGYVLVGDFNLSTLWLRQDATIYMSDSHSDFFTRNMMAILAEMRCALSVFRPYGFVYATLPS